jgi:hypothetical protein
MEIEVVRGNHYCYYGSDDPPSASSFSFFLFTGFFFSFRTRFTVFDLFVKVHFLLFKQAPGANRLTAHCFLLLKLFLKKN